MNKLDLVKGNSILLWSKEIALIDRIGSRFQTYAYCLSRVCHLFENFALKRLFAGTRNVQWLNLNLSGPLKAKKALHFKSFQGHRQRYGSHFIWKWMHFQMYANIKKISIRKIPHWKYNYVTVCVGTLLSGVCHLFENFALKRNFCRNQKCAVTKSESKRAFESKKPWVLSPFKVSDKDMNSISFENEYVLKCM